ncbi:MAG: hypothetical protein GVY19_09875 [Bacteroidetes bacterium]|jgi:hypothetical protein|nr:hypothetical protein [Bacteroidota bacterium]
MNKLNLLILSLLAIFITAEGRGQLTGQNLFLYQLGNFPEETPKDLSILYNQTDLQYRHKNISASIQLEQFYTKYEERNYQQISLYNVSYKEKGLELQVGNIFQTLGRGLLFRAYEIPGSVLEDQVNRVQYAFYRDLEGVMAGYTHDYFTIKAIRGYALDNEFNPTFSSSERRKNLVEALEVNTHIFNQTLGAIFMRNNIDSESTDFASVYLGGPVGNYITYHTEFAQQLDDNEILNYSSTSNYAFYSSLGITVQKLGVSLEYKDYQNFIIGGGINDPPALIKEHSYRVLNRSIHTPILIDEKGFQAEIFYRFSGQRLVTFNYTFNENKFARRFLYNELFIEYSTPIGEYIHANIFFDVAEDELMNEKERFATGTLIDLNLKGRWGSIVELEAQRFLHTAGETQEAHNYVMLGGVNYGSDFSANIVYEYSTDPTIKENNETFKQWIGTNISYKPNFKHTFSLFAGTRRGGPSCTSGICYEVPDFKGVELRIQSRL